MQKQLNLYEKGIDVSHWQGTIDWKKVADDGIQHVFIKMSEGETYTDPKFYDNWYGAKSVGLNVNAYHYFRAINNTSENQFANINRNLNLVKFDPSIHLLAIDVEKRGNEKASKDEMADHLQKLLELIKRDIPFDGNIILYCSPAYWDSAINWEKYDFSIYPLWIANWNVEKPRIPQTWQRSGLTWSWWQYSSKGKLNGINGPVDLDWILPFDKSIEK